VVGAGAEVAQHAEDELLCLWWTCTGPHPMEASNELSAVAWADPLA
jgi:hypothetical protein